MELNGIIISSSTLGDNVTLHGKESKPMSISHNPSLDSNLTNSKNNVNLNSSSSTITNTHKGNSVSFASKLTTVPGPIRPEYSGKVATNNESQHNINRSTPYGLNSLSQAKPAVSAHIFRNFRISKHCKRCGLGNSIIVYDSKSGSEICTRCGVVVEDRVINEEQEWRSFSSDGNDGNSKSRVGSSNDVWLDDGTDSQLVVGDKKLMKAMLKHSGQASSDRLIKEVFSQLRLIASNFNLHDNIIERCKEIVKELSNLNILKSGKKYTLAIVYIACREEGVSRTVKELLTYDRSVSEREFVRAINKLKKDLPRKGPTLSSSAAELMPRFCHYLQLSHEIVGVAEYVCRTAEQYINKSHRPNSLAAGAIYFVSNLCNIQIDMKSVAVAAKSGETTVRGVYRELLLIGNKLLPKDFVPRLDGGIETLKRRTKILD
ncbi:transcription initiation factor IIB [Cryptosporidium andersoni]|uniref:General transcription factor TFIIB n=1 Tax=Cryptosporidium andersoni TaxID=117008 RepID=A0A1J4MSY2_9CRYT|nr:transcription initiation factor IIB [Cryptosporidium andersoni]